MTVFAKGVRKGFKKNVKVRSNRVTETADAGVNETKNIYAELERAANIYAAQLERATKELGYSIKDYMTD